MTLTVIKKIKKHNSTIIATTRHDEMQYDSNLINHTVVLTMLTYILYDGNEHMISMHTTV